MTISKNYGTALKKIQKKYLKRLDILYKLYIIYLYDAE